MRLTSLPKLLITLIVKFKISTSFLGNAHDHPSRPLRFAFKTARIAGKVIKLGLRIQRARRGRGR